MISVVSIVEPEDPSNSNNPLICKILHYFEDFPSYLQCWNFSSFGNHLRR